MTLENQIPKTNQKPLPLTSAHHQITGINKRFRSRKTGVYEDMIETTANGECW